MKDNLFDVSGKIVVITGGLGQIGAQFVLEFLQRGGAKVAVLSRSANKEKAEAALGGKEASQHKHVLLHPADICKKESIEKALDAIEQTWVP